jgi:hypothetical protein
MRLVISVCSSVIEGKSITVAVVLNDVSNVRSVGSNLDAVENAGGVERILYRTVDKDGVLL